MTIEASIVEQLQELRRWQLQQQQELIRQQKEQREILTNEQNRMYQALSLSVDEITLSDHSLTNFSDENKDRDLIDLDTPDDECESSTPLGYSKYITMSNEKNNNSSLNIKVPKLQLDIVKVKTETPKVDNNDSFNQHDYSSEFSIGSMQSSRNKISIDEIPVPSPKKDFNTLLEERLKDSDVANDNDNKHKPVIKRPFLKKGQGLSRFMPGCNPVKNLKNKVRSRSASFSSGTQSSNAKVTKPTNHERYNTMPKIRKSITNPSPVAQSKLTLKNVPLPRKKPRSKSISSLPSSTEKKTLSDTVSDSNASDLDVKNKREMEEVRIFELLEDKAENSSFCSTSSTVIAFLQQSTPLKHKALLHSASKNKLSLTDIGDQTLEELVRTTKSNQLPPFMEPQKPVENKVTNWDEVPVSKLKNDKTVTGTILPYGTDIDISYGDNIQESCQDDNNMSLHVRFSEYNEYKTMTDTSSTSSDSQTTINYVNEKGAWSDCSATPDSSDVENVPALNLKNDKNNKKQEFTKSSDEDSDGEETEDYKSKQSAIDDDEEPDETDTKNETLLKNETITDQNNDSAAIFKSELLKSRLLELEREIEIFRKESAALTLQRQKVQEERTKLQEERLNMQRSYDEKEKILEMEKKRNENNLQEEKKRLAREKSALEMRMKDAWEKAQKSKQERQEIEKLREELDELKEEFSQKESKWSAANARQRSQMRVLQTENSKLKQEIEKLQQKRNVKLKKPVVTNTRAIHQINKFLAERKKTSPVKNENSEEIVKLADIEDAYYEVEIEEKPVEEKPVENKIEKVKMIKTAESIARTRNLYESLLKDATECLSDPQIRRKNFLNQEDNGHSNADDEQERENNDSDEINENEQLDTKNKQKGHINKQNIREVHHPDGRIEYWYPNGNVKKIFPDKCLTKMIYYNGDVREIDKNGTVKYFYASTRTWHTTMPDGLEILEFPDGQVERRSKDGMIEVSFPDGSVRIVQADGSEKWALKDGTIAETSADGEKILTLPNGQREIHTKDHKRREYPDGTIKLVYPDGVQETRYANGRVRLKDKDGNLIMDTHQ